LKSDVDYAVRTHWAEGGKPDEVARMALVLASGLASYVHGALIPVDGVFLSAELAID